MIERATDKSLIRPMTHSDVERVLAWRNDPEVRRYMYTQHEITLTEHRAWFEQALQNPRKHLLIFEFDNQPLGFVNFNELASGGIADWGFYAAPDAPKGSGRKLGQAALQYAFTQLKLYKIWARLWRTTSAPFSFIKQWDSSRKGRYAISILTASIITMSFALACYSLNGNPTHKTQ